MDDDQKLDKIMEIMGELKNSMTEVKTTLNNHMANTDKEISRLQEDIREAKEARKVIHQKADSMDDRIKKIESNPVFSDWSALKGKAFGTLWVAMGLIAVAVLLNALPNIQKLLAG